MAARVAAGGHFRQGPREMRDALNMMDQGETP